MKFCMACGAPIESNRVDEKFCHACRFFNDKQYQREVRRRFGERLKAAREKAGLSRKELSDECDISTNAIHYYENGQREPSLTGLKRLSRTLKVSADWLLGLEDDRVKHEPKI